MKKFKDIFLSLNMVYALLVLFLWALIIWYSHYAYSIFPDAVMYGLGKSGWNSMKENFLAVNGRWAQGLTNDYKFYEYRTIVIPLLFGLHFLGLFLFSKILAPKKMQLILASLAILTSSLVYYFYRELYFYLPTSNSYTLGFSLSLILYYFLYKIIQGSQKWGYYVLSFMIVFILGGMVELIAITNIFILSAVIFYDLLFHKKINRALLSIEIASILGFMILYYSPGNINRRNGEISDTEKMQSIGNLDFDFIIQSGAPYFEDTGKLLWYAVFFVLSMLSFLVMSKPRKFTSIQSLYIILASIVGALIPVLLGSITISPGGDFTRMYNTSTMYMVISVLVIAYTISQSRKSNNKIPIKIYALIMFSGAVIYASQFFNNDSNLGKVYDDLSTQRAQQLYNQEKAIRYYLIENQDTIKYIPLVDLHFKSALNYVNYNNLKGENGELNPIFNYDEVFSRNRPIIITESLQNIPSISYFGIYAVEQKMIEPVYQNKNLKLYWLKDFNLLMVQENPVIDMPFTVTSFSRNFLQTQVTVFYSSFKESQLDNTDFYMNKNAIAVPLPYNTYKIDFKYGEKTLEFTEPSIVDFNNIKEFESKNPFSIMN